MRLLGEIQKMICSALDCKMYEVGCFRLREFVKRNGLIRKMINMLEVGRMTDEQK